MAHCRDDDSFSLEDLLEQGLSVTANSAEQVKDSGTASSDPVVKGQTGQRKHMPTRRKKKDHSMYAAYASFS